MKKRSRLYNIALTVSCVTALSGFFLPWIHGEGSLTRPVDVSTQTARNLEPTGFAERIFRTGQAVVDRSTEIVTGIKLKQVLDGYQIPLSDHKSIKKYRPYVYILYVLPLSALACLVIGLSRKRRRFRSALAALLSGACFYIMLEQSGSIAGTSLFAEVTLLYGYFVTMWGFAAISILSLIKTVYGR